MPDPPRRVARARARALFFFNDTATTEIYTLSLHDALPISVTLTNGRDTRAGRTRSRRRRTVLQSAADLQDGSAAARPRADRKSTRLNSSHLVISYAVFCLKKKKSKSSHRRLQRCGSRHHCYRHARPTATRGSRTRARSFFF